MFLLYMFLVGVLLGMVGKFFHLTMGLTFVFCFTGGIAMSSWMIFQAKRSHIRVLKAVLLCLMLLLVAGTLLGHYLFPAPTNW